MEQLLGLTASAPLSLPTLAINMLLGIVLATAVSWFYANYGRAFAPPSSRVVGERKPEESRQIEVGIKKDLPELKGLATFAYYDVERENIGIPDANGFTVYVTQIVNQ